MKKYGLPLFLFLLAFSLRIVHYEQFPIFAESRDEIAWTWTGHSLLTQGRLQGWSWFSSYQHSSLQTIDNIEFRIVEPFLDNPVLFSFIPGLAHTVSGGKQLTIPSAKVVRLPMVLLGSVNVVLLYLALIRWKRNEAFVAAILYAVIPIFVFTSRIVLAENLVITLVLVQMIILSYVQKKPTKWLTILSAIVSGLAILTKITGAFILLASVIFLVSKQQYRTAVKHALYAIAIAAIYPLTGLLIDHTLFISLQLEQASRTIGPLAGVNLFNFPLLTNRLYIDGWFILGVISLVTVSLRNKLDNFTILIASLFYCWLIVYMMAVDELSINAWYRYPMYPLIAWSIAWVLNNAKNNPFALLPIFTLGVLPLSSYLAESTSTLKFITRLLYVITFVDVILFFTLREARLLLRKKVILGLIVIASIAVIYTITPDKTSELGRYVFGKIPF